MTFYVRNQVGSRDARTHFHELLAKVEAGEEFVITKRGKPVARLEPLRNGATLEQRRAAIARWRESSRGLSMRGLCFGDLINEGRKPT